MRWACAALVIAGLGGCSWFLVDSAERPRTPTEQPRCDPDPTWPAVDGYLAVSTPFIMVGAMTAAVYANEQGNLSDRNATIIASASLALGFTAYFFVAAAKSGQTKAYECAALHRASAPPATQPTPPSPDAAPTP